MSSRNPRLLLLAASALAIAALALVLLLPRGAERSTTVTGFSGAALPGGMRARDFTLTDQSGRRVSLGGFHGRVVVLAFLSTSCGRACVLIAQQIRGALDELTRPVGVLLISVDPQADTPYRVSRFLAQTSLSRRVAYLTGPPGALRRTWRAYGIEPLRSGLAAFERSAEVRLIDRSGRERVIFGLEQLTPEGLAHDVRELW